jgi:hypothetical protein
MFQDGLSDGSIDSGRDEIAIGQEFGDRRPRWIVHGASSCCICCQAEFIKTISAPIASPSAMTWETPRWLLSKARQVLTARR